MKKSILSFVIAAVAVIAPVATAGDHSDTKPKNLIIMISDGMGPQSTTGARFVKGEPLFLDSIVVGTQSTESTDSPVPDSAATATAIATGVNSKNGRIGQDHDGKHLATIMEAAAEEGYVTGLVATSRITHATPASFMAHVPMRSRENDIARQFVRESKVDFFLGGGARHFAPQSNNFMQNADVDNLMEEAPEHGFKVLLSSQDLKKHEPAEDTRVMGVFTKSHLPYVLDRAEGEGPTLLDLTDFALEYVSAREDKPFLLMIEGSRIDHAAHGNDVFGHMHEILEYDDAVRKVVEFAEKRGDTLVVSVADHECGGFTVGANGTYDFKYDDIKKVKKTIGGILREITADLENGKETFRKYIELDVTDEEIDVVLAANPSNGDLARELKQLLSRKIIVGWSTSGHTAGDVVRYAFGPGSQSLIGKMHHAEMGRKLQDMLGLREKVDAITAAARAKAPESQPSGD